MSNPTPTPPAPPGGDGEPATVAAPVAWVRPVGDLRLPARADRRLAWLMGRNNEGSLDESERAELQSLVELSEAMSLVRADALHLLGRGPG